MSYTGIVNNSNIGNVYPNEQIWLRNRIDFVVRAWLIFVFWVNNALSQYLCHQVDQPPQESAPKPSKLKDIRAKRRSQNGSGNQGDEIEKSANKEVEDYLCYPASEDTDTFTFWKDYSQSGSKARKCLARLARIHLTPAPTSTDVERLGSLLTVKVTS